MKVLFLVCALMSTISVAAETLMFPQGKGKCPKFTIHVEKGWSLKSDRPQGDRWWLLDASGQQVVRFDYNISNTDQKQLPEVEDKSFKLGQFKVHKYTVTTGFPSAGDKKITTDLVTSYSYESGRLKNLVVMTTEYDRSSGLENRIEKILETIE